MIVLVVLSIKSSHLVTYQDNIPPNTIFLRKVGKNTAEHRWAVDKAIDQFPELFKSEGNVEVRRTYLSEQSENTFGEGQLG